MKCFGPRQGANLKEPSVQTDSPLWKFTMKLLTFTALLLCAQAFAQPATGFPDGAVAVDTAELQLAMSGKSYMSGALPDGPPWKIAFKPNGKFVFYAGSWSDTGKWSTNKSEVCSDAIGAKSWCNDIRMQGDVLLLKSNKKGVVPMKLQ
jgi:hypothetical protein